MRLLLDENLDHKLRRLLPGHDVFTVVYMGWDGVRNGRLLALAASGGFDALITMDRGIEYEQSQADLPLPVILLRAESTRIEHIMPLLPKLTAVLARSLSPGVTEVQLDV